MRRTKEEAQATRENVLSSALHVFSQRGYAATRLEDIAKSAQVTRGAIYHHFGSKEELYKALVMERSAGINQLAEETVAEGGNPAQILRNLLVRLFEYVEEDNEYRALLELASKLEGPQSLMRTTTSSRRLLARFFTELLNQGVETGDFRADLHTKPAAYALVGFMNGMGLLWIQDQKAFSIRDQAHELVDVLLKGIAA